MSRDELQPGFEVARSRGDSSTKSGFGPCPSFKTGFVYGMKRFAGPSSPLSLGEQVAHANVPLVVLQSGQLPVDDE